MGLTASLPEGDASRIFNEPNARELLRMMLLEKAVLDPTVGGDGRVHYPLAEQILGPESDASRWISDMTSAGILRVSGTKDIVTCPTHLRADPVAQVECVKCRSRSSRKASLVEHVLCGYIGDDSRFTSGDSLVCPNCKRPIRTSGELRVSGVWYECSNCLSKTSSPKIVFVCKEGNHDFGTADLSLVPVPSYAVNDRVVSELRSALVLSPSLASMLSLLGYSVSAPASAVGQSGARHALDIYATKNGNSVALQIAVSPEAVEAGSVISFFAKIYDLKPTFPVLVTIPRASDEAKQLTRSYGILLVEDYDGSEAVAKVRQVMEKIK